jgi:hypothetical protein
MWTAVDMGEMEIDERLPAARVEGDYIAGLHGSPPWM